MPRDFAKPVEIQHDPLETPYESYDDMPQKKTRFPWWAGLIIALLIVNGGLLAYFLLQDDGTALPKNYEFLEQASTEATDNTAEEITSENIEVQVTETVETSTVSDIQIQQLPNEVVEENTEYEFYNWLAQDNAAEEDVDRLPVRDVFKVQKQLQQSAEQTRQEAQNQSQNQSQNNSQNLEQPIEPVVNENLTVDAPRPEAETIEQTSTKPSIQASANETAPAVRYSLQVGSFQKLADAERHLGFLKDKGFEAYTYQAQINGKIWNRVIVGNFEQHSDMEAARSVLQELGIDSLLIPIKD